MNMVGLIIALCFIAFDIISGVVGALKEGNYQSSKMREGLFHKIGEIMAILFSYGCEYAFPYIGITVAIPVCSSVLVYITIMETGSIIENLTVISPELKAILHKTFKGYDEENVPVEKGKHEKH